MPKMISFFLFIIYMTALVGCESHRKGNIQEEQERPQQVHFPEKNATAGSGGGNR